LIEPRIALPTIISPAALRRCDPSRLVMTLSGRALGTSWQVRFAMGRQSVPTRLREAIEARLAGIVSQMSQWEPQSLLSRFNRAEAGAWFALPQDFATVIKTALDIAERSDGAFDPTLGRAAALLGYGALPANGRPSDAELDEATAAAGWRRLVYEPEGCRLRQPGGLWLDLSGIAKGYAVDAIAGLLRASGIEDSLVEIGGELVGSGLKPDGQPWWVDLEIPPGVDLPGLRIGLHDMAVATSGDYVRGAHTLDPRSGRPLRPVVASVSLLHPSAMLADAWATALTVLGPDRGAAFASREALATRIIARDGDRMIETVSPSLRAMLD
jgi:thiamine biosynthesis lipoprotein